MKVRFISRPVHAVLDYLSSAAMLASPWVFDFASIAFARNAMLAIGIMVLVMSLLTNYEGGVSKKIAMSTHLWGDLFGGIFLAASPWLLFFDEYIYMPHVVLGIFSIVASLLTVNTSLVKRHAAIRFVVNRKQ